jgi:hypothetical protein
MGIPAKPRHMDATVVSCGGELVNIGILNAKAADCDPPRA